MKKNMLKLTTIREIRNSLGRYLAIVMIVALGVGFFSGLKVTKEAMISTANEYLMDHNMFDYKLISTLGYDNSSVEIIQNVKGVQSAEGSISHDVLMNLEGSDSDKVISAVMLPDRINTLEVIEGRLPEKADECVVDSAIFGSDAIGKYLDISENNEHEDNAFFSKERFKIVGRVSSPLFLSFERGSTSIGDGSIDAFMYIPQESFKDPDVYTDIYAKLDGDFDYFTDEEADAIDAIEDEMTSAAEGATAERYDTILNDMGEGFEVISILAGLTMGDLAGLYGFHKGDTYVLTSSSNIGYATFEENANIVNAISKVFPVFFFLVAAMVCMTTMTRMIDEQRTQIGVLKALGYTNMDVLYKYMFYSGSAAGIGGVFGFFFGSWIFPLVIWKAYRMMYHFESHINYIVNIPLFIGSMIAALVCTMGATWLSCSSEFREVPAELIRPKAPKAGKRIFLEKIPWLWSRLSFLHKVSLRNIFRYKKRLFMMVMGISGCTALLIAGFGIDTTISDIAKYQYSEIIKYDYVINFSEDMSEALQKNFKRYMGDREKDIMFIQSSSVDVGLGKDTKSANLIVTDGQDISKYIDLHNGDEKLKYPGDGEAIVCRKLNKQMGIEVGDEVTITKDHVEYQVKVSGICDNYVSDYVFINTKTYEKGMDEAPEFNAAYVVTGKDSAEQIRSSAAYAAKYPLVAATSVNVDTIDRVDDMMKSLNAVVILVIVSAGLLAFVVLYNLTNINITERIREIATIKVLGFYPRETSAYVFRENIVLTAISAVVGIPLGTWLLHFVIDQIVIDTIFFQMRITLLDYIYSIVLTFVFSFIVNIAMRRRLNSISMTESLKSIE